MATGMALLFPRCRSGAGGVAAALLRASLENGHGGTMTKRTSSSHAAGAHGLALRFARVKRYRTDKTPDEADTLETVKKLLP